MSYSALTANRQKAIHEAKRKINIEFHGKTRTFVPVKYSVFVFLGKLEEKKTELIKCQTVICSAEQRIITEQLQIQNSVRPNEIMLDSICAILYTMLAYLYLFPHSYYTYERTNERAKQQTDIRTSNSKRVRNVYLSMFATIWKIINKKLADSAFYLSSSLSLTLFFYFNPTHALNYSNWNHALCSMCERLFVCTDHCMVDKTHRKQKNSKSSSNESVFFFNGILNLCLTFFESRWMHSMATCQCHNTHAHAYMHRGSSLNSCLYVEIISSDWRASFNFANFAFPKI